MIEKESLDGCQILWLAPYWPWSRRHGGQIRTAQMIDEALAQGASITLVVPEKSISTQIPRGLRLVTYPTRDRSGIRRKLGAAVGLMPDYAWEHSRVESIEVDPQPEVLILEQPHQAAILDRVSPTVPLVYNSQNVEYDLLRQLSKAAERRVNGTRLALEAAKSRRLERILVERASLLVAVTRSDKLRFEVQFDVGEACIVSNGVDLDYFLVQDHAHSTNNRVVMTGTMGYRPNEEGALWLVRDVMPIVRKTLGDAVVSLVGGSPGPKLLDIARNGNPLIETHFDVPDVRPYVGEGDVFAAPMRVGGGSPLKVAEALASGIPTVVTSRIAAALDLDSSCVLIAETASDFADCIVQAMTNVHLRASLIENGLDVARRRFDWDLQTKLFAKVVAQLRC